MVLGQDKLREWGADRSACHGAEEAKRAKPLALGPEGQVRWELFQRVLGVGRGRQGNSVKRSRKRDTEPLQAL